MTTKYTNDTKEREDEKKTEERKSWRSGGPRNTRMTRKKEKTKKERRKIEMATEGKAGGWGSLWDACLCFFISCI